MKRLIVLAIVVFCIVLMYLFPHAMLNPGDVIEGHQKLNDKCLACHEPFWGISNAKCISCHKLSEIGMKTMDTANGRKANMKILFHQSLSEESCTSCHTDHKGVSPAMLLKSFNHEILPLAKRNDCNSCHQQPSDELHNVITGACSNCHSTKGWKTSVTFNHDMIQGDINGKCSSCHKSPEDTFHQHLQDNCSKCHGTSQWKPSSFDHSPYFQLDRNHNPNCNVCHTNNNFSAYTCYGCHEHSERKIMKEHSEHGINNFANCTSCHRSGDEHDIRMNGSQKNMNQNEMKNLKEYINKSEKESKKDHDRKNEHDD